MAANPRRKGKRGELEAAKYIARLFHVEAHRGRQYQGSNESPDICTAIPGIHFEVKRAEQFRLYQSFQQAAKDAGELTPLVLYRANRQPWLAIAALEDLPRLAELLYLTLYQG